LAESLSDGQMTIEEFTETPSIESLELEAAHAEE
jgi:hypothetical protein